MPITKNTGDERDVTPVSRDVRAQLASTYPIDGVVYEVDTTPLHPNQCHRLAHDAADKPVHVSLLFEYATSQTQQHLPRNRQMSC